MFNRRRRKTGVSFFFSVLLNAAILCLLLAGAAGMMYTHQQAKTQKLEQQTQIVQAVAVDQKAVEQQVQSIKANREEERQAQIRWKNQLQTAASAAQAEKQAAESDLKLLQSQEANFKQKASQEKQVAEQNLQRLKQLNTQAQNRLDQLQQAQSELQKNNALVATQLKETEAQLKQSMTQAERASLQAKLLEEKAQQRQLAQQQFDNEIARYKTLIVNAIERQWLLPPNAKKDLTTKLQLTLDPYGRVQNLKILTSSGDDVLDRSAITAVLKASPLPVPEAPILLKQFRTITVTLKPEGVLS